MNRRAASFVATILLALSSAGAGHAQGGASGATTGAPDRVVLRVAGADASERQALESSLRELLSRLGLTLEVSPGESLETSHAPPSALAVATIDLRNSARATATLVDPRTGRVVASREVRRDRSAAIVIDELAHIVHGTAEELADVRPKAPAPSEPTSQPAPVPPAAPPTAARPAPPESRSPETRPSGAAFDAGAFAVGRGVGSNAGLVFGGGLLAGVGFARERRGPGLWLAGSYHAPFEAGGELADAQLRLMSARLAATLQLAGGPSWRLEAGPAGGIDLTWSSARSSVLPASRLAQESQQTSPMVGALALARFGVAPTADVFVAASVDVDLAPFRYVVRNGSSTTALMEQWRVRPALAVGFTFDVVGPALYARATESRP